MKSQIYKFSPFISSTKAPMVKSVILTLFFLALIPIVHCSFSIKMNLTVNDEYHYQNTTVKMKDVPLYIMGTSWFNSYRGNIEALKIDGNSVSKK